MATTDTCPTCGNAHSGECTPAALKARIAALNLDRDTLRAQLAEAKATIARLNRLAH